MELADFSAGNLFITGELGSGKTMFAVKLIREYLAAGRPVATNLDLYLEHMMSAKSEATAIRLPDKPVRAHFDQLGDAYPVAEGYDESRFGLIVLDECLTWLNSRSWQDKERAGVLDWFLHARKHGWNVAFLMQSADFCDPQLRETLLTYHVSCRKMAKYRVPIVGKTLGLRMPKGTLATITAGYGSSAIVHDRELYRGSDLYQAYRTGQVFQSGMELIDGNFVDMRAPYTMLSAWHLLGQWQEPEKSINKKPLQVTLIALLNWLSWNLWRPLAFLLLAPFYPREVLDAIKTTRRKMAQERELITVTCNEIT
ncbi:hypothetical protein HC024_11490 [Methylococcaceae bacterium WWC4]|nr:hypothetical protein [Methylococcaceae bacterium WWC4]